LSYCDEEARVADAIAKLRRLRDGDITSIVDPTVLELGRNVEHIQRINAAVDLNISPPASTRSGNANF
jgi:phosphotriesterase-related protein